MSNSQKWSTFNKITDLNPGISVYYYNELLILLTFYRSLSTILFWNIAAPMLHSMNGMQLISSNYVENQTVSQYQSDIQTNNIVDFWVTTINKSCVVYLFQSCTTGKVNIKWLWNDLLIFWAASKLSCVTQDSVWMKHY